MKSLADELPAEFATLVHPDWRKNEADYWAARDSLLKDFDGQWVAYSDRAVIAHGRSPVDVLHAGVGSGRHPFVTCVGHEDQPTHIRRASFAYDTSYPVEPLPVMSAEFRATSGSAGVTLDRVIPDTGADATVLPWSDCQLLSLDPSQGVPGPDRRNRRRLGRHTDISDLGVARRHRVPLPGAGRPPGPRTNPRPGHSEPARHPLSRARG